MAEEILPDVPGVGGNGEETGGIYAGTNDDSMGISPDYELQEPGDGFSDDLLVRASQRGISEEQARQYGSPEILEQTLGVIDQNIAQYMPQQGVQDYAPQYDQGQEPEPETDFSPYELNLGDDVDPEVANHLKALNDYYGNTVKQLHSTQEQLVTYLQAQEARRHASWFEGQIAKLGDDWTPVFGKPEQRTAGSAFQNNFMRLAQVYEGLWNSNPNQTEEQLFTQALNGAFGEHTQRIYRRGLTKKAEQQKATRMGRPSPTKGPTLSGKQRAIEAVARFARERGGA